MSAVEIELLRREERFKDIGNQIADCVCYDLMSAPTITNRVVSECTEKAVGLYANSLPRGIIAKLVDIQAQLEMETRRKLAVLRAAAKKQPRREPRRLPRDAVRTRDLPSGVGT